LCPDVTPSLLRRDFLKLCGQFGVACACGCVAAQLRAADAAPAVPKALPDLKTRAHCGLICGDWCQLWKATQTNDLAAKQKVYTEWKWKEKFGVEFNPDQVFCHGCKAPGKPQNLAHGRCTVLQCNLDRGLESCLQCRTLAACDKELWKNYPDFRQQMIKLQQEYQVTPGFRLV
jgi:hypothetical protein